MSRRDEPWNEFVRDATPTDNLDPISDKQWVAGQIRPPQEDQQEEL